MASPGGVAVNNIARWDGSNWHAVGDGFNDTVFGLEVVGTDLYATGRFTQSGSDLISGVAKWDGAVWTPLGYGMTIDGQPGGLGRELFYRQSTTQLGAPAGDPAGELFVGGYFNFAGDKVSSNFGIYQLGEIIGPEIFDDGFETGDTSAWSNVVP